MHMGPAQLKEKSVKRAALREVEQSVEKYVSPERLHPRIGVAPRPRFLYRFEFCGGHHWARLPCSEGTSPFDRLESYPNASKLWFRARNSRAFAAAAAEIAVTFYRVLPPDTIRTVVTIVFFAEYA